VCASARVVAAPAKLSTDPQPIEKVKNRAPSHIVYHALISIPATTITLTGQSMIRGDVRADAPDAVPGIASLIRGDLALTSFEATIYDPRKGQTVRDGRFASPPECLAALQSFGFNLLALPSNHAFDMNAAGITNTLETVERLDLTHAGLGRDLSQASEAALTKTPAATVALIAVASGLIGEGRATATQPGSNELRVSGDTPNAEDFDRILKRIQDAKAGTDIVITSHHNHYYPGVERAADFMQLLLSELPERLAPPAWLEGWGRQLVNAGSDVVAMHGPPFMHGLEIYHGKPIFYSLGNFIFQSPPESIHLEEPIIWESIVAELDLDGDRVTSIRVQPIAMNKIGKGLPNPHDQFDVNEYHRTRGLPRPASGQQAEHVLRRLASFSDPYGTQLRVDGTTAEVLISSQPPRSHPTNRGDVFG